jgi:hypothetical protein
MIKEILTFALYLCAQVFGPSDAAEFVQKQLKVLSISVSENPKFRFNCFFPQYLPVNRKTR